MPRAARGRSRCSCRAGNSAPRAHPPASQPEWSRCVALPTVFHRCASKLTVAALPLTRAGARTAVWEIEPESGRPPRAATPPQAVVHPRIQASHEADAGSHAAAVHRGQFPAYDLRAHTRTQGCRLSARTVTTLCDQHPCREHATSRRSPCSAPRPKTGFIGRRASTFSSGTTTRIRGLDPAMESATR